MRVIEQTEIVAQSAWDTHPASQRANIGEIIETCVAGEEVLAELIKYPSPYPQILDKVYLRRQKYPDRRGVNDPRIEFVVMGEPVSRFVEGAADYLSFETHPEWTLVKRAAEFRWLTVRGWCGDDRGKRWEREYIFDNYSIRKQEKLLTNGEWRITNANAVLDIADINTIRSIFNGIQSQVMPLLVR